MAFIRSYDPKLFVLNSRPGVSLGLALALSLAMTGCADDAATGSTDDTSESGDGDTETGTGSSDGTESTGGTSDGGDGDGDSGDGDVGDGDGDGGGDGDGDGGGDGDGDSGGDGDGDSGGDGDGDGDSGTTSGGDGDGDGDGDGCGDGNVDFFGGEECDDGNNMAGDGCENCMIVPGPTCGNGNVESGEECDAGANNSDTAPDTCRTNCKDPFCGDGVTDWGANEQCDDANLISGDGCDACVIEAPSSCGDGTLDIGAGEECDDGGTVNGDGCSGACQLETVGAACGNGASEGIEVCDDNNVLNGDTCNPTCNMTNTVTNLIQDTYSWGAFLGLTSDQDDVWIGGQGAIYRMALGTNPNTDCPWVAGACSITLVAGQEGTTGSYTDADGTAARMGAIESMATDGDTVWFTDGNHTLRAMSTTAPYTVTTLAGDPSECGTVDGALGTSRITGARGVTYYDDNVYLVDACEGTLRSYNPASGDMSTLVGGPRLTGAPACGGNCNEPGSGTEGYGTAAEFVSPRYSTSDNAGNIYVIDTNGQIIRTYNTVNGYSGTLAGSTQGYTDGTGTQAQFDRPRGISSDGTSIYVSEQNQSTVRQIIISSQEVTTMAGVRGCANSVPGQGGTGQTGQCAQTGANNWANFDFPFQQSFHYPTNSIFMRSNWGIQRIH